MRYPQGDGVAATDQGHEVGDRAVAEPAAETVYIYKPSLLGAPWEFRLESDRLVFAAGTRTGSVPYSDIRRVRLSFRPVTMQSYRFLAEIWSASGPKLTIASTSWRGLMEQERLDRPYRDFILALHRRIAGSSGSPVLEAGSPPFLYWPGVILFAAIAAGVVALLLRALVQDSWAATAFLAGFFVLLLWQLGGFFRRNRPRRYDPLAVPDDILPRPNA
jgi:hypothetical protein